MSHHTITARKSWFARRFWLKHSSPRTNPQKLHSLLSLLVILSLILPSGLFAASGTALAEDAPVTVDSTPIPAPSWEEQASAPQTSEIPTFDPIPAPESVTIDASTELLSTSAEQAPVFDPETLKRGVVPGVATLILSGESSAAQTTGLQLSLRWNDVSSSGTNAPQTIDAEVLTVEQAQQLSPVGFAFKLSSPNDASVGAAQTLPLEATIDYSQIPLRHGGDFVGRLRLFRATGCDATLRCSDMQELPGYNDIDAQQLTVDLASSSEPLSNTDNAVLAGVPNPEIDTAPIQIDPAQINPESEQQAADALDASLLTNSVFLPLVASGSDSSSEPIVDQPYGDEVIYVLAAAATSTNGTYSATPLAASSQFQVSLATGSAQTSYPLAIPPAAGGLAPQLSLNYDSGRVDGMASTRNSQASWVGIGWGLESGYIQRRLDSCYATKDLCMLLDSYTIVLNGVASRLIKIVGTTNQWRLQNDPYWKVEKFSNAVAAHPDRNKEYWIVSTPDGTKYRFGGEFNPDDTNLATNDQNSALYTPVYDQTVCSGFTGFLCNKVWRWNLDRVEDTNGNILNYYYTLEMNYYSSNTLGGDYRKQYVRAGTLIRIDYGMRKGNATTIPTRVVFQLEDRCDGPCTPTAPRPDTPTDLTCAATGTCIQKTPTFWTTQRLNYILPQVAIAPGALSYRTVITYDLDYNFPVPPGTLSDTRMVLSAITQRSATSSLPPVQYGYTMLHNRHDNAPAAPNYVSPFYIARMNVITSELGGITNFTYWQSHPCNAALTDNIRRPQDCVVRRSPSNNTTTPSYGPGYWNHWKIRTVETSDSFSLNPSQTVTYTYSTPTSHIDDDPMAPGNLYYWSDFRGSEYVTETYPDGKMIEHRFHRGMHDDSSGYVSGQRITVQMNINGVLINDYNWYRGREIETRVLSSGSVVKSRSVTTLLYAQTDANTANTRYGAYFVATSKVDQITPSSTGDKTTRSEYKYDAYGNVTREVLYGDISHANDDRTLERTYTYSITAGTTTIPFNYLVNRVQWEKLWAGALPTGNGVANSEKSKTEYLYDNLATVGAIPTKGNLTTVRNYYQVGAFNATTTTYDIYGRPTVITDARGNSTTTGYHSFYGSVTTVTNDLGHVSTSITDPGFGVVTQTTDPNGKVTTAQYDAFGRLSKVWLPSEPTAGIPSMEYEYHPEARPAWVKSRTLRLLASATYLDGFAYVDGFGRQLQTQAPLANGNRSVTSQRYNNLGQVLFSSVSYELSGAAGAGYSGITNWATVANYTQSYYDDLGRAIKSETRSTNTLLWFSEVQYDGWLQKQFDAKGNRRDSLSDAFGKLVKVNEYNYVGATQTYTTTYAYDLLGNLTTVIDSAGNVTTMGYDLLGRKTSMTDPDMGSWVYQYDATNNLTGQRDARNLWLYMSYDDLNRLVAKRKDNPVSGALVADYLYDTILKGMLARSRSYNSLGTTVEVESQSVTFDTRNRPTTQQWLVNGGGTFRMGSAFNEANQKTSMTYPGNNSGGLGEVVSYGYNAVGQLTNVSGLAGIQYVSSVTYNSLGQMTQMVNENGNGVNGLTRQMLYETNTLRLNTIRAGTASPFENLQKLSYAYDKNGNVTSLTDNVNSGQVQTFGYDWLNRLVSASTNAIGIGQYNQSYAYDAIGNITSFAGNPYVYGDAAHKHAVTAAFGNTYAYDANGNQTTRTIGGVTYTFTYDYENHITAISGGGTTASFVYDASGIRVKGTVNGVTTLYIGGVYEYQNGATTLYYEGNAIRRSGYASNNGITYLLQDHLQSSSALINQNGTVNGNRNYLLPFGGNRGGTVFNDVTTKRFTGQYHEKDLPGGEGLSYYGARWYDAKLGRFLSADSIVPTADKPQDWNRYSYVVNNPLKHVDPDGHRYFTAQTGSTVGGRPIGGGGGGGIRWGGSRGGGSSGGSSGGGIRWGGSTRGGRASRGGLPWKPVTLPDGTKGSTNGGSFQTPGQASRGGVSTAPIQTRGFSRLPQMDSKPTIYVFPSSIDYGIDLASPQTVLSGHGGWEPSNGLTTIPEGTTMVVYSPFGARLSIELGKKIDVLQIPPNVWRQAYGPGSVMPNYTLEPISTYHIAGDPVTVNKATLMSELIGPNMGVVHWSACTDYRYGPWSGYIFSSSGPSRLDRGRTYEEWVTVK